MKRLSLSLVGAAILVIAVSSGIGAKERIDSAQENCAKACNDCQRACDFCATHCVSMMLEGKHAAHHAKTLRTCQDCATHCSAAARIMSRQGIFADLICTACAEACKRCGDECATMKDDQVMKRCVDECRKCEKACRDMLKHIKVNHKS